MDWSRFFGFKRRRPKPKLRPFVRRWRTEGITADRETVLFIPERITQRFEVSEGFFSAMYDVKTKSIWQGALEDSDWVRRDLLLPLWVCNEVEINGAVMRIRYGISPDDKDLYLAHLHTKNGILYKGTGLLGKSEHALELTHYSTGEGNALHCFHGSWKEKSSHFDRGEMWFQCREVESRG